MVACRIERDLAKGTAGLIRLTPISRNDRLPEPLEEVALFQHGEIVRRSPSFQRIPGKMGVPSGQFSRDLPPNIDPAVIRSRDLIVSPGIDGDALPRL